MDLIDDEVIPNERAPYGTPSSWDEGDEDGDDYYEDVIYECYK